RGREHAEPEEGEPPEHVRQAVRRGRNAVLQYVQREPPAHAHCGLHGRCDGPAARVTTGSRQRLGPIHVRFSWSFLELTAGRAPRPGRPPCAPISTDGPPGATTPGGRAQTDGVADAGDPVPRLRGAPDRRSSAGTLMHPPTAG